MRCTLTYTAAHHAAWKIGVLHRDLSPGNILIVDEGDGLLIDWDLCKITKSPPEDSVARQYTRTVSKCLKHHISRVLTYFY
jgi:RIO-like serine/threonine protein kinase